MAEYWIESEDGETSVTRNSWPLLKIAIQSLSWKIKCLCIRGDDYNFTEIVSLRYPSPLLCIYSYNRDIIWENTDSINYCKTIYFYNCEINVCRFKNLEFNEIKFFNSKIPNLKIQVTSVGDLEISRNSEIDNFQFGDNRIKNLIFRESKFGDIHLPNLLIDINFIIESVTIKTMRFDLGKIENMKIKDSEDNINIEYLSTRIVDFNVSNCKKLNIRIDSCDLSSGIKVSSASGKFLFYGIINKLEHFNFILDKNYEAEIIISKSQFSGEVVFSGENYKSSRNLILKDSVFKDLVIFNENISLGLEISKVLFQKGIYLPINTNDINIDTVNLTHSSVWCTLKNQALARNDKISALELGRYEMEAYMGELKLKKNKCQEKIVLWLNKTSNRHGLSWGRGVYFTIKCWLFSFMIFYVACNNFNGFFRANSTFIFIERDFWIKAFNFLWIPQGFEMLSDGLKSNVSIASFIIIIISFLLGKILIGYGIFQTISAFRKHSK